MNAEFVYGIEDDLDAFAIDGVTGLISVKNSSSLDRETRPQINVTVRQSGKYLLTTRISVIFLANRKVYEKYIGIQNGLSIPCRKALNRMNACQSHGLSETLHVIFS